MEEIEEEKEKKEKEEEKKEYKFEEEEEIKSKEKIFEKEVTYKIEYKECSNNNKLISEKNICIEECSKDDIYKYEYKNKCYISCPKDTKSSENNVNFCELKCSENLPYEIISTQQCIENCSIIDLFNNICKLNYQNIQLENELLINIGINIENGNFNPLISNLIEGEKKDIIYNMKYIYISALILLIISFSTSIEKKADRLTFVQSFYHEYVNYIFNAEDEYVNMVFSKKMKISQILENIHINGPIKIKIHT